jgi:hypothetical protein
LLIVGVTRHFLSYTDGSRQYNKNNAKLLKVLEHELNS